VYRDVAGKFRFRLRAANNKIVAVSQGYERKADCINGVKSVQKNCMAPVEDQTSGGEPLKHPKYVVFLDSAQNYRFHLTAPNGQVIAASEGYASKQGCMMGIEAVQKSCDAEIEDLTLGQTEKPAAEEPMPQSLGSGETVLTMSCPPESVDLNSTVTFQGKLVEAETGAGIAGAEIRIYERDRSFIGDDLLVSGKTAADGSFRIDWKAKQRDWWDDSVEVYARYVGDEKYKPSTSDLFKIRVLVYLKKEP